MNITDRFKKWLGIADEPTPKELAYKPVIEGGVVYDHSDPRLRYGVDSEPVEQHDVYIALSPEERAKGFVRPVRSRYVHMRSLGGCGTLTTMSVPLAETYARQPTFYGATYCAGCGKHRPVGENGEFDWVDDHGASIGERVGT